MDKKFTIYQIKNIKDDYIYIGKTSEISNRLSHHRRCLKNNTHGNKFLQEAYNDNGIFSYQILYTNLSEEEADFLERKLIKENKNKVYNFMFSGKPKEHSDETRLKISLSKTGTMSGENNPFYGKKHSEDTIQKLSRDLSDGRRKLGKNAFAKKVVVYGKIYGTVKEGIEASGYKKSAFYSRLRNDDFKDIYYYKE